MEKLPYHHLPDGTFRNPEGSPIRDENFKWSFKIFNKEKKKLDMTVPEDHVIPKEKVSIFKKLSDRNRRIAAYLKSHPFLFGLLLILLNQGASAALSDGGPIDLPPDFPF